MDWTTGALITSHAATAVAAWFGGRWFVLRNFEAAEHDGHIALERKHCEPDCPEDHAHH